MAPSFSALNGKLVTIFGGGGFVGRHAAQALMQTGARVRIVQRHPERALAIRALGNLGQTQFVAADARNADHVARATTGSDAVVNLISVMAGDLDESNVRTAANIAAAARDHGVGALVHLSAIGADAASPAAYGRSKAAGEAAMRAAMPGATVLRPSVIFGRQDQFINRF
ncbi:MAG: NAD-dependent epimerase/dehydratase family protein, partial [Sphingopyxis sp.]